MLALKISMMDVQAEIQTALGRSDIVVFMDRYIYIIEFKMGSAQTALDQIEVGAGSKPAPTPYWKSRELGEIGSETKDRHDQKTSKKKNSEWPK